MLTTVRSSIISSAFSTIRPQNMLKRKETVKKELVGLGFYRGRVAMWNKYGLVHSYTIEAGYNMCSSLIKTHFPETSIPESTEEYKFFSRQPNKPPGFEELLNTDLPETIPGLMKQYQLEYQTASYFFTQRDYEYVGRELAGTLLDLVDRNPVSRLYSSPFKNLRVDSIKKACKLYLGCKILQELPFRLDKYGFFLTSESGVKFEKLLLRYLEEKFVDEQVLKDFSDAIDRAQKKRAELVAPKKKATKVIKKKPTVQVMMNPKARKKERQMSVPTNKPFVPPSLKEIPVRKTEFVGSWSSSKRVSKSQNLKKTFK